MSALEFDADSVYKTQESLMHGLIDFLNDYERPLRRATLPEMPPAVRSQVVSGLNEALAVTGDARVGISAVAKDMKAKIPELYNKKHAPAKLGWGYKVGDGMVAFAEITGTDVIHKAIHHDEYGWGGVASSGASFALTFVPITKVTKIGKLKKFVGGGKSGKKLGVNAGRSGLDGGRAGSGHLAGRGLGGVEGRAGAEALGRAGLPKLATNVPKKLSADGTSVSRHISNFETDMKALKGKWRMSGGHLDSALNANHYVIDALPAEPNGVRWVRVASKDALNPRKVTRQWKSFFPSSWTADTVLGAAAKYPKTGVDGVVGEYRGVKFTIFRDPDDGALKTIYPNPRAPRPE